MWISQKMRPAPSTVDADLGVTTIAGSNVGVVTRGEVRDLPVYGPGGCVWMPENGSAVLVIRGGPGGEELCVAGCGRRHLHPVCARENSICMAPVILPSTCGPTGPLSCGDVWRFPGKSGCPASFPLPR